MTTRDMGGRHPLNELPWTWGRQGSFQEVGRTRHAYVLGLAFTLD